MVKQIFVNLAVKDLDMSIAFFSKLGFKFNKKFTDKNAACMIISKDKIFSMLIVEKYFKTFTKKKLADAKKDTEVLIALSFDSKKEVDSIMSKVIKAGGRQFREAKDHGWMYERSFEDLDSHVWEVFWMDPSKIKDNK